MVHTQTKMVKQGRVEWTGHGEGGEKQGGRERGGGGERERRKEGGKDAIYVAIAKNLGTFKLGGSSQELRKRNQSETKPQNGSNARAATSRYSVLQFVR